MSLLIEQVAAAREKMIARAKTDYPKLLARAASPKKGDAARMPNVCELLGISLDQFEADAALVESIPRMLESIAAVEGHRAELKLLAEERRKWVTPDRRANPKERKEFDEATRQHTRVTNKHAHGVHRAKDAAEHLKTLCEKNWWAATVIEGLQTDDR